MTRSTLLSALVGLLTIVASSEIAQATYDPVQGRFKQLDPVGLVGGQNLYQYVGNNPVTLMDPSGRAAQGPPAHPEWPAFGFPERTAPWVVQPTLKCTNEAFQGDKEPECCTQDVEVLIDAMRFFKFGEPSRGFTTSIRTDFYTVVWFTFRLTNRRCSNGMTERRVPDVGATRPIALRAEGKPPPTRRIGLSDVEVPIGDIQLTCTIGPPDEPLGLLVEGTYGVRQTVRDFMTKSHPGACYGFDKGQGWVTSLCDQLKANSNKEDHAGEFKSFGLNNLESFGLKIEQ